MQSFQGSEGMWRRESYMKLAEEKEGIFLVSEEKLISCLC